jgi:2-dehydropantoate 2-reductase
VRIAVMGTGGVGGYFGGLLAHSGEDVSFIARGEHLRALQGTGLRVESRLHENFTVAPAHATGDPADVGPVDLVLLATKTYQIEDAARAARPLVGPQTTVLPLQNGVDASERSAGILGPEAVLGGVCYLSSYVAEPGLIRQESPFRRIIVGELDGRVTERVEAIAATLRRAGIDGDMSTDINRARWTKYLFIAAFSGIGAVTRVPAGEMWACPETRTLLQQAMLEVESVGRAQGVSLEQEIVPNTLKFFAGLAPGMLTSMQRDVMEQRPSEIESLIGYLVRRGAELGVPTPIHQFVYGALLPQERRARGL